MLKNLKFDEELLKLQSGKMGVGFFAWEVGEAIPLN
jgi:hypothetical protein